jgi:Domain of unknown function (DUF5916)/Carbohydrate family 9 binding domain-like
MKNILKLPTAFYLLNFLKNGLNGPLSIFALFCLFCLKLNAQTKDTIKENKTEIREFWKDPKPTVAASRITRAPKIDGDPTDEVWKNLPVATDFVQHRPKPYTRASQKTDVKIAYDDVAIYALVYMYDTDIQGIKKQFGQRDDVGDIACDYVNLAFDSYNDDQNAFRFGVTAAGVQFDSRISDGNNTDRSWDAVYYSEISMQKDGWVAEFKIPFSALRFAAKDMQTWGFHVTRGINRLAEENTWSGIDPKVDGIVIQYGSLTNLEDIKPPLRLQFSPYLATAVQRAPSLDSKGDFLKYGNQTQVTGGMDLKYGINQSFTIDMTLIPNFGQVQSDNQVLNLSPFEVQFNENRPFFTEGSEIFNKGDLFYSRRIGGTPDGYYNVQTGENEIVKNNPTETQLYNATKFSGRTKNNLAIGVLNAVTAPMYATIENTKTGALRQAKTGDLTNYNIISLSQALKNNSELTFVNASTVREQSGRDANVSALYTRLRDKKNNYQFYGGGRLSQIFEVGEDVNRGFTSNWNVRKVSGNWTWAVGQEILSDKWDPNDLGIFQGNNFVNHAANLQYQQVKPSKIFQESQTFFNVNHNLQYSSKRFMDYVVEGGFWGKFKSQWWANVFVVAQPIWGYDFFEPRVEGKVFRYAPFNVVGTNLGSDDRKKFGIRFHVDVLKREWEGHNQIRIGVMPRYRASNKLSFTLETFYLSSKNEVGFSTINSDDIIFGRRTRTTVENTLSMNLSFNAKSNLTFRARHYWSKVSYDKFFRLNDDGNLNASDFNANKDRNINFFNIDMVYTWQFAPGSFMNIIWKNSINKFENGMDYIRDETYFGNVGKTFNTPQTNNLTLKVIYFLDYLDVQKKFKKGVPKV